MPEAEEEEEDLDLMTMSPQVSVATFDTDEAAESTTFDAEDIGATDAKGARAINMLDQFLTISSSFPRVFVELWADLRLDVVSKVAKGRRSQVCLRSVRSSCQYTRNLHRISTKSPQNLHRISTTT